MAKPFNEIERLIQAVNNGDSAKTICKKFGISSAAFYSLRARYQGMDPSAACRYRMLELELLQLKNEVEILRSEHQALLALVTESTSTIDAKRQVVTNMTQKFHISERRACQLVGLSRSALNYNRKRTDRGSEIFNPKEN